MTNLPRRRRLDPAKTRDTILAAAFGVFADKGYDGTSIADIAAVAQVPKSLLQYHFGTKDQLWKACLDQKAVPLLQPLDRFLVSHDAASMAQLAAARFRVLRENPPLARVLAWASMGSAPLPDFLVERREQLTQIGSWDSTKADMTRLLFALAAMDGWFLYRDLYHRALGDVVAEEALSDKFLQFLVETVLASGPAIPTKETTQ